jgi:hypothetical protein
VNSTARAVKYLKVTARDMLLVFDLEPKASIELSLPHQKWGSWVEGEGQFADGKRISSIGVNFYYRDKLKEPLRYCMTVAEDGLSIESPVMDGEKSSFWSDGEKVPIAADCRP